jgi:hypothetical protein
MSLHVSLLHVREMSPSYISTLHRVNQSSVTGVKKLSIQKGPRNRSDSLAETL